MASSSVAPRADRHYNVDPNDTATLRAMALADWAGKNRKAIIGLAAAALVLVAGILWYRYDQARRASQAATEFLQVQQQAESAGNPAAAAPKLNAFISRYDGTPEAAEARLALAEIHLRGNEPKKAVEILRGAADGSSPLAVQSAMMLGAAQARSGDRNAAIQAYTDAAGRAEANYLKSEALSEAALLQEQAGNWKGAADLYRQVAALAEKGSMDRTIAEMRLAEAEARARGR